MPYYVAPETPMMSQVIADCPDLAPQYFGQVYASVLDPTYTRRSVFLRRLRSRHEFQPDASPIPGLSRPILKSLGFFNGSTLSTQLDSETLSIHIIGQRLTELVGWFHV